MYKIKRKTLVLSAANNSMRSSSSFVNKLLIRSLKKCDGLNVKLEDFTSMLGSHFPALHIFVVQFGIDIGVVHSGRPILREYFVDFCCFLAGNP